MRLRLQRLSIALCAGRLLFLTPLIVMYVILPIACISIYYSADLHESRALFIYLVHSLVPMLSMLWMLTHLQIWIDSDGVEALYATRQGSNMIDLMLLTFAYLFTTLPVFVVASIFFEGVSLEWLRLGSIIFLLVATLDVLAVSMKSVAMASMIVLAYAFISVLYSHQASLEDILLLKPHRELWPDELIGLYLPILIVAFFLFGVGHLIENRFRRLS